MTQQTNAQRLADRLEGHAPMATRDEAAAELRRLDAENKELKATQYGSGRLQALRDERDEYKMAADAEAKYANELKAERDQLRAQVDQERIAHGLTAGIYCLVHMKQGFDLALAQVERLLGGEAVGHVLSYKPLEHTAVIKWYPAQNGVPPAGFNVGTKLYTAQPAAPAMVPLSREAIIDMAKQAGFKASIGPTDRAGNYQPDRSALGKDVPIEWLERFATLVRGIGQPVGGERKT